MWPGSSLGGHERGVDHPPKGVWREGFLKEGAQGASAPWAKQGSRARGAKCLSSGGKWAKRARGAEAGGEASGSPQPGPPPRAEAALPPPRAGLA